MLCLTKLWNDAVEGDSFLKTIENYYELYKNILRGQRSWTSNVSTDDSSILLINI